MRAPKRIQRKRTKGWRLPENTIVVTRPSRWGNPWRIVPVTDHHFPFADAADVTHIEGNRSAGRFERITRSPHTGAPYWAAQMFRQHVGETPGLLEQIRAELRGHDLACWCPLDQPCHADVLLEIANDE